MASFDFARGCVYRVDTSTPGGGDSGSTIIEVSPPISSTSSSSPVLLTGVQTNEQDLVLPVVTLDNFRILYTYGEDFGGFNIVGVALLGRAGGTGKALSDVVEWFAANRVTRSETSVSVSLGGGGSYEIFVTGLSIAEADLEYHIQPFIVAGRVAQAP